MANVSQKPDQSSDLKCRICNGPILNCATYLACSNHYYIFDRLEAIIIGRFQIELYKDTDYWYCFNNKRNDSFKGIVKFPKDFNFSGFTEDRLIKLLNIL